MVVIGEENLNTSVWVVRMLCRTTDLSEEEEAMNSVEVSKERSVMGWEWSFW